MPLMYYVFYFFDYCLMSIIQSAWWIVYYIHADGQPRYLLIKRHALSKKIEWVAPKWKINPGESVEHAALREIGEEVGLSHKDMTIKEKIGMTKLRNHHQQRWLMDKDVTYFLVEYTGDPQKVRVEDGGGFIGVFKRATITEILWLMYYQDMRELIRKAHFIVEKRYLSQKNS